MVSVMKNWHLVLILLILSLHLQARQKTDVLVMRNGDRMTCEVKGLDAGVLYVSFDYIDGTTSVDWLKVARLESTQLFVVRTEDGAVYSGTLHTPETGPGRPVKIQVTEAAAEEVVLDRAQIVGMIATSDKFWQRFNGQVGLGVIYSKGNQSTQYSLTSETAYIRERWSAQASFDSNLSSSTGTNASTRNQISASAMRLLPWNNWYYSGIAEFLQSSEQGIDLQRTLGGGLGRYFVNTNRASLAVLGGAAWQATDYKQSITPLNTQNLATALFYAQAKLFRFSKTSLAASAVLLPALSDPGRVRFNANASYYIKIVSDLKWNVSFYGNWDNRPPPGFSGSDYGTSSGLTWTFGLK
jgi:putative salt-induced outer membrane protein YdiY